MGTDISPELGWHAAAEASQQLTGILRIGVIPTMLAATPLLTEPCQKKYPGITVQLNSLCAEDIWKVDNWLVMPVMFGSHNLRPMIILGVPCYITA